MQKILYDIKGFIGIHWHDDKFRKLLTCETKGEGSKEAATIWIILTCHVGRWLYGYSLYTLYTFLYGKYFIIIPRFLSITYYMYPLLEELLLHGSLIFLHALLSMPRIHDPDHSLPRPPFRTVFEKISFGGWSNVPHPRIKSRLAYHSLY